MNECSCLSTGGSFTGSASFTSRHSNSAMWPRPGHSSKSSMSGQQQSLQHQHSTSSSMFSVGTDAISAAALAREAAEKERRRPKKMNPLMAARTRFKHLRNRSSNANTGDEPVCSQPVAAASHQGGAARTAQQHASKHSVASSAMQLPEHPGSGTGTAVRQVKICADSVCSLQVWIKLFFLEGSTYISIGISFRCQMSKHGMQVRLSGLRTRY